MAEKKTPGRFCVQFNPRDPRHQQVIELLERQGRRKAQFIVEAVLREGDAAAMPDMAQLRRQVEAWVKQFLDKQPQDTSPAASNDLKAAIRGAMAGLGNT